MKLSVLIPTYQERDTLSILISSINENLRGMDYEIVVIDDNSPDGTGVVADGLAGTFSNIKVLHRPKKLGLGSAIVDGLNLARGDVICVMDADLQHPPQVIPLMFKEIVKGSDFVVASRYIEGGGVVGWGSARRVLSKGAIILVHTLLPQTGHISDPVSGFFMFTRKTVENVSLKPKGFKILLEILTKGFYSHVVEVPYHFKVRRGGKSKLELSEILKYIFFVFQLRMVNRQ